FVQVGLESLGEPGPRSADAEALALAWRAAAAGGRTDLKATLGDIGLFAGFVDGLGLASTTAARLKRAFLRPGKMAGELERAQAAGLARGAGVGLGSLWAEWAERIAFLAGAGVPAGSLTLSTAFGRPFGYYDGFLFEVWSEALGADEPVAAGGRYDSLLARMG